MAMQHFIWTRCSAVDLYSPGLKASLALSVIEATESQTSLHSCYVCVCMWRGGCLESIAGVPASMWDSGIGSSPLQFAEAFQKLLMCLSFSGLSKRLLSSSQKQVDRELWSSSQSCWTAVLNLSPLISLDGCKVSGGACGTSCPLSLTQATYPCPIPMPDTQQGMHRYTEIQGYVPPLIRNPLLSYSRPAAFLPQPHSGFGLSLPQSSTPLSCISFSPHLCCLHHFSTTISKTSHASQKLASLKWRHSAQASPAGSRGYGGEKLYLSQRVWTQTPVLRLNSCVPSGKLVNISVASSLCRGIQVEFFCVCYDAQGESQRKCRRTWEWMLNEVAVACLRSRSVVSAMRPKSSYVLGKCSTSRLHPSPSFC